jgi:hypothetical protein
MSAIVSLPRRSLSSGAQSNRVTENQGLPRSDHRNSAPRLANGESPQIIYLGTLESSYVVGHPCLYWLRKFRMYNVVRTSGARCDRRAGFSAFFPDNLVV